MVRAHVGHDFGARIYLSLSDVVIDKNKETAASILQRITFVSGKTDLDIEFLLQLVERLGFQTTSATPLDNNILGHEHSHHSSSPS